MFPTTTVDVPGSITTGPVRSKASRIDPLQEARSFSIGGLRSSVFFRSEGSDHIIICFFLYLLGCFEVTRYGHFGFTPPVCVAPRSF